MLWLTRTVGVNSQILVVDEITFNFVWQLTEIQDEAHMFRLKLILKYEIEVRTPFTGEMFCLLYSLQE